VDALIEKITLTANTSENLMPIVIEAVENLCTLGEIADSLRKVFGEHR
jgi:methylmalonyl-CoA mutase N-terminal domain/subunit